MRAPSQERKESAAEYDVRMPIKIDPGYVPGDVVTGDVARTWATFRQLLSIGWLRPRSAAATSPQPVAAVPVPSQASGGGSVPTKPSTPPALSRKRRKKR